MKNVTLFFLSLSVLSASAQTEKGSTIIGGSMGFQTTSNNSNFLLNPNIGVFAAHNFAIGGSLNLNFSKQGDVKNNQFGVGPYMRYYFGKTMTKPFIVTEANYLNNKVEATQIDGSKKTISNDGYGFLIGLGFAAFVNDVVAVEGISGYNYSDFKNNSGSSGFALRFGFQLYFNHRSYDNLKTNVIGSNGN